MYLNAFLKIAFIILVGILQTFIVIKYGEPCLQIPQQAIKLVYAFFLLGGLIGVIFIK